MFFRRARTMLQGVCVCFIFAACVYEEQNGHPASWLLHGLAANGNDLENQQPDFLTWFWCSEFRLFCSRSRSSCTLLYADTNCSVLFSFRWAFVTETIVVVAEPWSQDSASFFLVTWISEAVSRKSMHSYVMLHMDFFPARTDCAIWN